jgi:PKD repeat protein
MTGCMNTYCDTVVVGTTSSCNAAMTYSTNNTLSANFSATATGTAPFTYTWDFGDSSGISTVANPTYTYGSNGVYYACVTITDANGCVATDCSLLTVNNATSGSLNVLAITDSMSGFPQAVIYLIEHDTVLGTLTAIQTDTTMQGFVTFNNVPFGNYLVKAALLDTDPNYANYLPTYYTQSLNWSGGSSVQVAPNSTNFTYVELIQGANAGTGPGFIGGLIVQGANRGPGDPVVGALVILYDENMNPIGYTYTDNNGDYSFDDLPYGVYYVYIEELGLNSAPVQVTLSTTTPSMDQVGFEINSTSVRFTNTNEILSVSGLKVYPNPVTDQLYMQFELDQMLDAEISIINVTGQVISNFQETLNGGSNLIKVSTNELPTGVYSIHLKSKAGIITQKFIKQ